MNRIYPPHVSCLTIEKNNIHPMFHVSQLKKMMGSNTLIEAQPPILTDDFEVNHSTIYYSLPTKEEMKEWELFVQ